MTTSLEFSSKNDILLLENDNRSGIYMRRIEKYRRKKQKKILIIGSLSLLLFLCVGYAAFNTNLSITAKGNIKEKSRIIQSWSNTDQTDFHSDFYKQNIVSATFLDNNNVPSNATESWNISEDKENGGVIAWVVPNNEDSTKYDLYIGAKDGVIANENSEWLFYNFVNMKSIEFKDNFDTSQVTSMYSMFRSTFSLTTIDLSSFNTHNVTNMHALFSMYSNNGEESSLSSITFGENFDTSNVTNMVSMFHHCNNLKDLDVSMFDTSNVTDMLMMFYGCESLTNLDLNNFDTSKVTNMYWMFDNCHNLEYLNLCSFNTSNVTSMSRMFSTTKNLKQVKVGPNWITAQADTSYMFEYSNISSVTTGQC